ncbi:CCR4-NOT transcription complex subunit 3 [Halotydeus destructor]|nr:CCR4-NOT transcription complex subunit 3 [Halotydeus destructor]
MADRRKLQGEIEKTHKKVAEGVETFEEIWQKAHNAPNSNQKEKYEADLKKEIKKLQRLRDQIKTWLASSEIKDKRTLTEDRKLIETQMERFKVLERETKTKAYSKEGLGAAQKQDPAQRERDETIAWLQDCLDKLNCEVDKYESEVEATLLLMKKKKSDKSLQEKIDDLKERLDKHRYHITQLELLLRMLDNETVNVDEIKNIKDDVEYYINSSQEPDFYGNEEAYADIDGMETFDEYIARRLGNQITEDNDTGNTSVGGSSSPISLNDSPAPSPGLNHNRDYHSNLGSLTTATHTLDTNSFVNNNLTSSSSGANATSTTSTIVKPIPLNSSTSLVNSTNNNNKPVTHSLVTTDSLLERRSSVSGNNITSVSAVALNNNSNHTNQLDSLSNHHTSSGNYAEAARLPNNGSAPVKSDLLADGDTFERSLTTPPSRTSTSSVSDSSTHLKFDNSLHNHISQQQLKQQQQQQQQTQHPMNALSLDGPRSLASAVSVVPPLQTLSYSSSVAVTVSSQPTTTITSLSASQPWNSIVNARSQLQQQQQSNVQPQPMSNGPTMMSPSVKQIQQQTQGHNLIDTSSSMSSLKHMARNVLEKNAHMNETVHNERNQTSPYDVNLAMNGTNNQVSVHSSNVTNAANNNSTTGSAVSFMNSTGKPSTPSAGSGISAVALVSRPNSESGLGITSGISFTAEAHIPPLLGVAPLGPYSLPAPCSYQLRLLETASRHTIHPIDSQRLRLHLPPNVTPTPSHYPQQPLPHSDSVEFYHRLSTESLFFIFYFMEGTKAQYLAAKALKKQSWRFHTKYMMWFQRHEEPKTITDEYEQGTYIYFDFEKWGQRKKEHFTFEYRYLEDRDLN